ncbi:ATP-dependent RNA helicase [Dinochytrium kinnereticum]|nr:ATP-dependent RNA helicase [Dinochytrium kinnereticum]
MWVVKKKGKDADGPVHAAAVAAPPPGMNKRQRMAAKRLRAAAPIEENEDGIAEPEEDDHQEMDMEQALDETMADLCDDESGGEHDHIIPEISDDEDDTPRPFDDLGWQKIDTPFLSGDPNDNSSCAFLGLEEIEGVDVEVITGLGGGRMIQLKKVKEVKKPEKKADKKNSLKGLKFIHIDDFKEPEVTESSKSEKKEANKKEKKEVSATSDKRKAAALKKDIEEKESNSESKEDNAETKGPEKDINLENLPPLAGVDAWKGFRLHDSVLRGLSDAGFSTPTEIQTLALRSALNTKAKDGRLSDRDIIGAAETGSGKTLAYGLPILQAIALANNRGGPRKEVEEKMPVFALILTPTRELAIQVTDHLKNISKHVGAKIVPIVGGISLEKQRRMISYSPDIIVATPGRLWELASSDPVFLQALRAVSMLILDEADRMLESGHFKDLDTILSQISLKRRDDTDDKPLFTKPEHRRTFVFSATLLPDLDRSKNRKSPAPKKGMMGIADLLSKLEFQDKNPIYINTSPSGGVAEGITEAKIDCLKEEKDVALYYLVTRYPGRTLVFVNSIDALRRLLSIFKVLKLNVLGLHAEMQQRQRLKNLERFKSLEDVVLIASDVAARGLDIPTVDHVLHYQIPRTPDLYIHRSGRTARASSTGISVLLCSPEENGLYRKLCVSLKKDDGLSDFPLDHTIYGKLRDRVVLARKIEAEEHKTEKGQHGTDWMKKAAEEAEIMLDSETDDDDDETKVAEKRKRQKDASRLSALKTELSQLLAEPVIPKSVSSKYLTSNVDRDIASILAKNEGMTDILPTKRPASAISDASRKHKKARK